MTVLPSWKLHRNKVEASQKYISQIISYQFTVTYVLMSMWQYFPIKVHRIWSTFGFLILYVFENLLRTIQTFLEIFNIYPKSFKPKHWKYIGLMMEGCQQNFGDQSNPVQYSARAVQCSVIVLQPPSYSLNSLGSLYM